MYEGTEGIIYIAKGDYSEEPFSLNADINITFIGYDSDTYIPDMSTEVYGSGAENVTYTFINLTFTKLNLEISANFINCTFINPNFNIMKKLNEVDQRHVEEYGYAKTYFMNFDNCVFKDVTTADALVTLYKYGAVNFNNCTFENIVADSLVYHNDSSYFEEDGISFKNCTFVNSKFNGVVDSVANFDDAIVIEYCTYDSEVSLGTTEVDGHFYVNATKLPVTAVDTNVTVKVADISYGSGFTIEVNLLNNVSGDVSVSINNKNYTVSVVNGSGSLPVSDVLDAGNYTAAASFTGDDVATYSSSNTTAFTVAKANPIVTISGGSKVYNVAKTLTITLANPVNGTVNVVIGSQKATVKVVNGKATVSVANLKPGNYDAKVTFADDINYNAASATAKLTVTKATPKLTAKKATFKAKTKTKKYTITLKTNKNQNLKGVKVTIKIGKKTFKATTNSKGKATFKITKLTKKGTYKATVKTTANAYYKAVTKKNVKIVVKK